MQRDMAERGHSLESIKASIEARKPDFDAYIGELLTLEITITSVAPLFILKNRTMCVRSSKNAYF